MNVSTNSYCKIEKRKVFFFFWKILAFLLAVQAFSDVTTKPQRWIALKIIQEPDNTQLTGFTSPAAYI